MWHRPQSDGEPSDRITIYYGGVDTVTALAFTRLDNILEFLRTNSE